MTEFYPEGGAACVIMCACFDFGLQDGDRLWERGQADRAGEAEEPAEGGFRLHDPHFICLTHRSFAASGQESYQLGFKLTFL